MRNIMLDLETLGRKPGCVVLSIGAVRFDGEGLSAAPFHAIVNRRSCEVKGLGVDPETELWWSAQSEEARALLKEVRTRKASPLKKALEAFADYVKAYPSSVVWGNGSDFDQPILAAAYEACGLKVPWLFYNSRCYRTLKSFAPGVKLERTGIYHSAVDDAVSQARHAVKLVQHLGWKL